MRCTRRERSRSRGGISHDQQQDVADSLGAGAFTRTAAAGLQASAIVAPEVHVLYASPLDQQLPQIDVRSELEALEAAIQQAQGGVRLRVGIATTRALTQLLTRSRSGGRQTVLHLSAHVASHPQRGTSLVLETAHGEAHVLDRAELEGILGAGQRLEGLPLVFLNSCWSESMAQLFVESGCRHVIATRGEVPDSAARAFTQQFYYALCSQQSVLASWESAQQLLRVESNPKLRACADLFVLFGQRNAQKTTLWGMAGEVPGLRERSISQGSDLGGDQDSALGSLAIENPVVPSVLEACKLPPRVEDFVGRGATICQLLRHFDGSGVGLGRRACVVSGPAGIGKSAVAVELAHFASAPGRLFSRGVLFVGLRGAAEAGQVQESIAECLRAALPELLGADGEAGPRLRRAFQQLERQRGRRLLVIDDSAGALQASPEVRQFLSGLLEATQGLCIAAFSRECVYESLGSFKCVNVRVPGLSSVESAQLFLKRIHRPLQPCDFEKGATSQTAIRSGGVLVARLAAHPLMQQLGGNPGDLRLASQRVTPELRSLFDLCDCAAGAAPAPAPAASAAGGPLQLQRGMSVDEGPEAGAQQLSRKMSVDDGPQAGGGAPAIGITRLMSVDEQ